MLQESKDPSPKSDEGRSRGAKLATFMVSHGGTAKEGNLAEGLSWRVCPGGSDGYSDGLSSYTGEAVRLGL